MFAQVALFCWTCEWCQLWSSEQPKVAINPTWVPTVLHKLNMDLVEMGIRSSGYEYTVDVWDDLTGWLEAWMLARKLAELVIDFFWQDIICWFGCIPQITTDNGTELCCWHPCQKIWDNNHSDIPIQPSSQWYGRMRSLYMDQFYLEAVWQQET